MAWLSGFSKRRKITITAGSNGMPAGYQVKIVFDTATEITQGDMQSDGRDIRFTKADGETLISYWIEKGINTANTVIWFKDPDSLAANASHDVYMYYKNPDASAASNGNDTFEFFEDFNGSDIDTNKWDKLGTLNTNYKLENSFLKFLSPNAGIRTKSPIGVGQNIVLRWKFAKINPTNGNPIPIDSDHRKPGDVFKEPVSNPNWGTSENEGSFGGVDDICYCRYYNSSQHEIVKNSDAGWRESWLIWASTAKGYRDDVSPNKQWECAVGNLRYWYYKPGVGGVNSGRAASLSNGFRLEIYHGGTKENNTWYDFILINKYVDPEPTKSIAGEEALPISGSATLLGIGSLSVIGGKLLIGQATLIGEGLLNAIGNIWKLGSVTLSGIGLLTAKGVETFIGRVTLTGTGLLSAIGSFLYSAKATLSGIGNLIALGRITAIGKATLSGIGSLAAIGGKLLIGQATLIGTGLLNAIGNVWKLSSVTLSGIGSLTAKGIRILTGNATLSGLGSLTAKGVGILIGKVILTGTGLLSVTTKIWCFAVATLSGIGSLTAKGMKVAIGKAILAGKGLLSAIGMIKEADIYEDKYSKKGDIYSNKFL